MLLNDTRLLVEIDEDNGGLKSIVQAGDPDGMNWIAGHETWGQVEISLKHAGQLRIPFAGLEKAGDAAISHYETEDVRVDVRRSFPSAGILREEIEIGANRPSPLFFGRGDVGIYTPFNDDYPDAETCERLRCNTHLWCGGEGAHVRAVKMGPAPFGLGLVLREGSLDSYSVERLESAWSNDRGDFILHPSPCILEEGEKLRLVWDIFAFPDGQFRETVLANFPDSVLVSAAYETVFRGETFHLRADAGAPVAAASVRVNGREVAASVDGRCVTVDYAPEDEGEYRFDFTVNGKSTFARCLCVAPLDEICERRLRFIIEKQQYNRQGSPLDGAFLIYDNEEKRPFFQKYVGDHNACRERLGMALLLARYLQRHENVAFSAALAKFERFVLRECFDEETGAVFNTIGKDPAVQRLYNAPWMISFWEEMYRLRKDPRYLDYIYRAVCLYFRGGGTRFYPNGAQFSNLVSVFRAAGRAEEAEEILAFAAEQVGNIVRNDILYPKHEVNFEQTIVSPAADLTCEYALATGDAAATESCRHHIAVLERFDGDQPDHRLGGVPIRHWDGYWFGRERLYGDTFPHYWSVLSARAYLKYEKLTGDTRYHARAIRCLRNCLCSFFADGSASCAYLYPFSVRMIDRDGKRELRRRGEFFDPWANDQDFALFIALQYL